MIPRKLYLPTSSLNFNNIMSSETISPFSFYSHRKFGYERFYKVEANDLNNTILLYDKYPIFAVDNTKLENYPIVFEIDTQIVKNDIQEFQGIFISQQTIYLNPFGTKIIFRNATERQIVINKAFPMIEAKMIPLYQGQFDILSGEIETFKWYPIIVDDLLDYDNNAVSHDIAINKLKGLLYGYLLGANNSSSPKVVSLKQKVKELRNVLSAVIASSDGRATHFQDQLLKNLYNGINQELYELSDVPSQINKVIAQKIEHYNAPTFVEILKGEGLYQEWLQKQVSLLDLRYYHIMPFCLSHQATDKVAELDNYINSIDTIIRSYDKKGKLDMSKMPVIQNRHILEIPDQKEFLSTLFCEYMDEVWNGAEFLSSRYDFARVGGKLFREKTGENWEKSPARTYINSLLKNLNEYTEFDINSTDSIIQKSFAAFCQKGESDIDILRDYLISNGIGDFRIAFALWGLIFGFAEMPKTLTNDLFENQDEKYISDCYKYIYKQLHSIELTDILDRTPKKAQQNQKSNGKGDEVFFRDKQKDSTQDITTSPIAIGQPKNKEKIEKVIESFSPINIQEKSQSEEIVEIIQHNAGEKSRMYDNYYHEIISNGLTSWDDIRALRFKGNDGWKGLVDKCRKTQKNDFQYNSEQRTLFDSYNDKLFYTDNHVWDIIRPCIHDRYSPFKYGMENNVSREECIKRDLSWFKKMLALPRSERGYQTKNGFKPYLQDVDEKNNKQVITEFCQMRRKELYWNRQIRDEIKQRLLSLYCSND